MAAFAENVDIPCEACDAGMRRAPDGIHYKDGPDYKGAQTGQTWGVCRKLVRLRTMEADTPNGPWTPFDGLPVKRYVCAMEVVLDRSVK